MQHGTCWTFVSLSAARWAMRETPCTRRGDNEWQPASLRIRLLAMSQWYRADWKCATAVGSKRSSAHSTAKESAIRASDFSHKHHRASFHPALSSRHRTWAFKTANCYFRYNIYIIKYEKKTKQYLLNPKFPFFLSKRLTRRNIERPGNKHQKSDSCSS